MTIRLHISVSGTEVIEVDESLFRVAVETGCVDEFVGQYTNIDVSLAGTITEPNGSVHEF